MPPPTRLLSGTIAPNPSVPPAPGGSVGVPSSLLTDMLTKLETWWQTLKPWGSGGKASYFRQAEVASISLDYPCPKTDHTIRLIHDLCYSKCINASEIKYEGDSYNIGQTPTAESLSGVMTYLSDTIFYKNGPPPGLIQIVSTETHERKNSSKTMVGMLRAELNKDITARRTRADWFRAKFNLDKRPLEQSTDLPQIKAEDPIKLVGITEVKYENGDPFPHCRQYQIDLELVTISGNYNKFSVPLTQIGLPFDEVIKAEHIKWGRKIKQNHCCWAKALDDEKIKEESANNETYARSRENYPKNGGPLFLSKHGHGRNATLAIFDLMCEKIEKKEITNIVTLEDTLEKVIDTFRAGRPYSVHSSAQAKELLIALSDELNLHSPITQLSSPRQAIYNDVIARGLAALANQRAGFRQ